MKKIDIDSFEDFYKESKKSAKKDRKLAQASDRSQFKKTDQDQQKKEEKKVLSPSLDLKKGRVLSISGETALIESEDHLYSCFLRGLLKKEKTQERNLLAVGDFVLFSPKELYIYQVEERCSILAREDLLRKKKQIIAVNIDQVLITASVVFPPIKPSLIDRYIIAAKKGNMRPVIVINKIDLLENKNHEYPPDYIEAEKEKYLSILSCFSKLKIPVIGVSCQTKEGLEELFALMKQTSSVFTGQSGVGKTSLINFFANTHLKTGDVVQKTFKGSHVTTKAELIPLEDGGFCIDTPGIKSFGLWQLKKEEIEQYFSEIATIGKKCKFPDCSHGNEPDCAVKKAVEKGKISLLRFESYHSLIEEFSKGLFKKR